MADRANVRSVDTVRRVHLALSRFTEKARAALDEVSTDVHRTRSWLEFEQLLFWKTEIRRREQKLAEAKNDLQTARMSALKESCVVEREKVRRAERRLEESQRRLVNVKRWIRALESEAEPLVGRCRKFSSVLEADMPRANEELKRMIAALEAYTAISLPPAEASMKRPASEESEDEH